MSEQASAALRFGRDGRILGGRVRQSDGHVWCPCCREFVPPSRISRSNTRGQVGYEVYCYPCRLQREKRRFARNPEALKHDSERKNRHRVKYAKERSEAEHQEYQRLLLAAMARLRAIGLRRAEIARLTGLTEHTVWRLNKPECRHYRSSMELIFGLLRVASDIEPGPNRQGRMAPHDFYPVLERRMVAIHEEIAQRRASGAYVRNLGSRVH